MRKMTSLALHAMKLPVTPTYTLFLPHQPTLLLSLPDSASTPTIVSQPDVVASLVAESQGPVLSFRVMDPNGKAFGGSIIVKTRNGVSSY